MKRSHRLIRPLLLGVGAVMLLAFVACSEDDEATTLTITASDFAYAVAGDLTPGATEVVLENDGEVEHHVQLLRIDGEQSIEEAIEATAGPPVDWLMPMGGVAGIAGGRSASVIENLAPGRYAMVCFLDAPDGVPHFAKGMVGEFTIAGDEVNEAEIPEADVSITATDDGQQTSYDFAVPETIEAGEVTLALTNDGAELHEVALLRLPEGGSLEDLLALFSGEAPSAPDALPVGVGGVQGILPGATQTAKLDLDAGTYALICAIPNAEGVPHAALGMARLVTVE